jgi:hypothetical protein
LYHDADFFDLPSRTWHGPYPSRYGDNPQSSRVSLMMMNDD